MKMTIKSKKISHDSEPMELLYTFEYIINIKANKFILIETNLNIMDTYMHLQNNCNW